MTRSTPNPNPKKEPPFLSEGILYLQKPPASHFLPNLRELKRDLDSFFKEFYVKGWQIAEMRALLAEGRAMYNYREMVRWPPDYETEKACGSILGLYTIVAGISEEEVNFTITFPDYKFEEVLRGVGPGMTPENTPVLRQLDQVLALCEKERTKK